MPPFSKDVGRRGGRHRESRGTSKITGSGRPKGKRSGHRPVRNHDKGLFYSTRVEEQLQGPAVTDTHVSDINENDSESLESSSGSGEENLTQSEKPYRTLLQYFDVDAQRGESQSKQGKIETPAYSLVSSASHVQVDEPEDVDETDDLSDKETSSESGDVKESTDPYVRHYAEREDRELLKFIATISESKWKSERQEIMPRLFCHLKTLNILGGQRTDGFEPGDSPALKGKFKIPARKILPPLDRCSSHLAFSIFNYMDCFCPIRSLQNSQTLRILACLHAINHVFKTRDKIIKNNERLAKEFSEVEPDIRDQGFTRPKVLIILPTRNSCVRYVDAIMHLCQPDQQENKKRFYDSFLTGHDSLLKDKSPDFSELFAGNDDDMFRLGLKFTRKTVKYFSQFYNSDIILGSPLGLRMALGGEGHQKQDKDFLSSIEVVVFDQADAVLMQNWEHVEYIFQQLNTHPKEAHGCDFSRVRNWYLDGHAKYLRQTIVFSAFSFPSLNRLCNLHMLNIEGKVKYCKEEDGVMATLNASPRQIFSRFDYNNPSSEPDSRFKYFISAILPSLTRHSTPTSGIAQGVLVYLPSYADFVHVRNHLANSAATQNTSFGSISEYTSAQAVARARSHFLSGRHSVLLYTERAHHFRRYHLKGVKKVIMYGLPENPTFYKDIVQGFLSSSVNSAQVDAREATVRALFSRLDILKLERVVGSSRYLSMLNEKAGDTFDFV